MKNKLISFIIIFLSCSQIIIFIFLNNYKKEEKIKEVAVYTEKSFELREILDILQDIKGLNIKNIVKKESQYEISVEIVCEKEDLEKILMDINYFGVISYTITVEENNIYLSLTMKERLNNNCI